MTVQYTGPLEGVLARRDYTRIVNGSRASASLVGGVHKNQTWLGFEDPGAVNFFSGPATQMTSAGTATLEPLLVEVPPGCTHVEFWVLAVKQENPDPATGPVYPGELLFESALETQRMPIDPVPGLKLPPTILLAKWYTSNRLAVRATAEPVWTDKWVTIKTSSPSPGIWLYTGYYRCLPPRDSIPFDDLVP